ncbi:MAG: GNAT family N-acetyltransferase [Candidatus Heimdallarchaeota archaeon]|nr:MAG: GNAT family N-acetyltransferase [Candidatus Heimdallarchaeota archaeon]
MIQFLRAQKEDLPYIERIIQEAYKPMKKILSRPPGALDNTAQKLSHALESDRLYAIYEKQDLIGTFSLALTDRKTVKLFHFAIKPQFQNQGLGSWVVKEVIKNMQQIIPTAIGIEIEIYSKIPSLLRFYKKFGFTQIGEKHIRGEKILILGKFF